MTGCRILSCGGELESPINDRFQCLGGWGRRSRAGPCLNLGSRGPSSWRPRPLRCWCGWGDGCPSGCSRPTCPWAQLGIHSLIGNDTAFAYCLILWGTGPRPWLSSGRSIWPAEPTTISRSVVSWEIGGPCLRASALFDCASVHITCLRKEPSRPEGRSSSALWITS